MAPLYDFPLGVSKKDPHFGKILRMIEGFRGYETLESLRVADDQVRGRLAAQLRDALEETKGARERLSRGMHLQVLADFDRMAGKLRRVCERMSHPETEKLAVCRVYRPEKELMGDLYAVDFKILGNGNNIFNLTQEFQRMVREDLMLAQIHKIEIAIDEIAGCLEKKGQIIACMIE